eukprot:20635-Heterococcus_DN1.PRE.6
MLRRVVMRFRKNLCCLWYTPATAAVVDVLIMVIVEPIYICVVYTLLPIDTATALLHEKLLFYGLTVTETGPVTRVQQASLMSEPALPRSFTCGLALHSAAVCSTVKSKHRADYMTSSMLQVANMV